MRPWIERRELNERSRRAGRPWVRPWIEQRESQCAFSLVGELYVEDPGSFRNYLRMTEAHFEEMCGLVATNLRMTEGNFEELCGLLRHPYSDRIPTRDWPYPSPNESR